MNARVFFLLFLFVCVWLSVALWIDKYACLRLKMPCCLLDAC